MYPQVFGKYVLERELSRGGMARVILATLRGADGFEKRLVVKQIRDELALDGAFVRRFVDEAKTNVALSHPNIVPVYELGVEQGTYFIAMELVEGVSLSELIGSGAGKIPLSPEEGAYVGVEVCRALDYAHRRMNVVHRDVTPRNVMIDEEGQVKVIDFGIAAPAMAGGVEVFGSPGHMPPEQMRGQELGPPTDIFAVAVLLMEAWSGKPPFRRPTAEDSEAAMRGPHPKPSEVDPRLIPLDDAIVPAMALDASERPKSADDLARALRKFLSGVDTHDLARGLGERVRRRRSLMKPTPMGAPSRRRPQPSQSELVTKTFAARDEVEKWKSEAPPASDAGPSTRRVDSEAPAPPSDDKGGDRIETVATRPLETPVEQKTVRRPRPADRWRLGALGVLAVAGASAIVVWRTRETPSTPALPTIATSAPSVPVTPSTAPSAPIPTTTVPPSATTSATAPEASRCWFALFGDPGTRVSVDGVPRGSVPIAELAVEPGNHDIRFTFDATGESSGKRVAIRAGERVRIRADFTGASPTVQVQR